MRRGGLLRLTGKSISILTILIPAFAGSANASAYALKILHSFANGRDGGGPISLAMDQVGNFYGTAGGGPHHAHGVIYELVGGKKFKTLYGFCAHNICTDGKGPTGPLVIDVAGNLYGTTAEGGANGAGTAFELSPNADRSVWTLHTLYNFCSLTNCADGSFPSSGLSYAGAATGVPYDGVSPLFGTTSSGGSGNSLPRGVVFQLAPGEQGWSETVLYSFCSKGGTECHDGALPVGGVLVGNDGSLFGTTAEGGLHLEEGDGGAGVIYELTANGGAWNETTLYKFCSRTNCKDGKNPGAFAALVQDSLGNLYGTTAQGGNACNNAGLQGLTCGVIFKIVPNGEASEETVLYKFCSKKDCKDGAVPESALLMDASGNIFGTTEAGGGNDAESDGQGGGTVFRLAGSLFDVLYRFCAEGGSACTDGLDPGLSTLLTNSSGDLFGTTVFGGEFGVGEVFKLTPKP